MQITKIVITGGPCAGKSTAMARIQKELTQLGYTVLFVPETATELITGGVAPWTCGTNLDYQKRHMHLQLEKERLFEEAGATMDCEKLLIVCDRGVLDNRAYMNEDEYKKALEYLGKSEIELRDNYDAVFHLVSASKGAEQFYTVTNNSARKESVEQARELDDRVISAWTGHPHLRVIENSTDFEGKMKHLVAEIMSFLGEPEPLEIERKFLIEYPDTEWLTSNPNCKRVEIVQTYLESADGSEVRVRQRGCDGSFVYFKTVKKKAEGAKRIEIEKRLSREEYSELLHSADTAKRQILKTRYLLVYENQYFEIDVYPFWNDKAIVEIELSDENAEIKFPKQLKIIKEVTDDETYKNSSLAKM